MALALWKWQMFEAHSLLFGDVMKFSEVACWISLTIHLWDGGFSPLATSPVFLSFSFSRVFLILSDSLGLNPILNESRLTSMFDPHMRATLLHILHCHCWKGSYLLIVSFCSLSAQLSQAESHILIS